LLDGKKIAGILIENQWSGSRWQSSIVGIGINVNQTEFTIPHATSLASLNDQKTEVETILRQLQQELSVWYQNYCNREFTTISQVYHATLFGKHETHRYTNQTGSFDARVKNVLDDGRIELEIANGTIKAYALSEISLSY
jgi:BirA family biotin operon repressor/biotin-[acetyl-CoA-carboxylase] ligase